MTTITLPLTEAQAVSIVVAADAFGVEPWEMAVHVLDFKRRFNVRVQHIDGKKCEDCGGPGVSWEDGLILCDDCAILRAKRAPIDGLATGGAVNPDTAPRPPTRNSSLL